jgi:hypothetical protein
MPLIQRFPICLILLVAVSTGCDSSEPFTYVQTTGKVTYEDGSLIQADYISVTFLPLAPPVDARTHPRPGYAEVNVADGTFKSTTSHKHGDGLTAGEHIVLIRAFDKEMTATRAIPIRYSDADTTPLRANTDDATFHFKIAK